MDGYDTASPSKSPTQSHKRWHEKEKIGQGAQGTVYRCVEAATGRTVAIKEINTKGLSDHEIEALMSEATVMKSLQHKHIVQYHGVKQKKRTLEISMEFMPGGSLSAYIRAVGGSLTLERTKNYTWQLLRAVQFLHEHRIAHRDIKSANVLLSEDQSQIKLADFGALKEIGSISVVGGLKGTPHWMAPEVIKEQQTSEGWMKADIWSLGCTVLEMLTGRTPWQEYSNPLTAMYKIVSSDSTPQVPDDLPPEAIAFVQSCFQRDPAKRPEAGDLLHSAFLKSVRKLKKSRRTAVDSPKSHPTSPEVDSDANSINSPRSITDLSAKPVHPHVDDMPKSRIRSILTHDNIGDVKHRKAKKPIKLEPLPLNTNVTNQEKSTPKIKSSKHQTSLDDSNPAVDDPLTSPSTPRASSPCSDKKLLPSAMSPQSPNTLAAVKSLADGGFPTIKKRPELRRIATAPQSVKRLGDVSPKTIKLPPLSARSVQRDQSDHGNNNA
ncbi:hypothetical protein AC1031_007162 [Aphanomyces cochlioides]|nr:hypothetical protein AC1031_007162 [Aphanomyces cochlioides]